MPNTQMRILNRSRKRRQPLLPNLLPNLLHHLQQRSLSRNHPNHAMHHSLPQQSGDC